MSARTTYYVIFRDYSVWVACEGFHSSRKSALSALREQVKAYPGTSFRVVTQKQADRLKVDQPSPRRIWCLA